MTRKCARPNQALELCTGSENTDVIRRFRGPSDTRDKKVIHAISIAYTTVSIRFTAFCSGYKGSTQRLNATSASSSHQQAFTGPAPAFWIRGGRLPLTFARGKFQPYYAQTLYPVAKNPNHARASNLYLYLGSGRTAHPNFKANRALQTGRPPVLLRRTYIYNE